MVEVHPRVALELAPSETVVWTGQPRQGLVLRGYDAFALPFGLIWLGVVLVMCWSIWRAPYVDPIGVAFSLLFVVAGFYLVLGRFFIEAKQRSRTFYALTNERIVIASGLLTNSVKSVDLKNLNELALSERRNGSGSIVFGPTSPFDWMYMPGWPGMGSRMAARFDLIPDVRQVYEAIRTAQRAHSK